MDIKRWINGIRRIPGAVTVDNAMDVLDPGKSVFVLLYTQKQLVMMEGELVFIQHHTSEGTPDIKLILKFLTDSKPRHSTVILGLMFNGWSDLVGDEDGNSGYNRVFSNKDDAVAYFKDIQFVHDTMAQERSRSVQNLISRLINTDSKKKPKNSE